MRATSFAPYTNSILNSTRFDLKKKKNDEKSETKNSLSRYH